MRALPVILLLAACAGDPTSRPDAAETDQHDSDLSSPTTASDSDAAPDTDTPSGDTDAQVEENDLVVDTGPTCNPIAFEEVMAVCGGTPAVISHVGDPLTPGCPSTWQGAGASAPDLSTVLADAGCDTSCVHTPYNAVMVRYCDVRGEFITWRAGHGAQTAPRGCEDWLQVDTVAGSAWVRSFEDYEATHPCP